MRGAVITTALLVAAGVAVSAMAGLGPEKTTKAKSPGGPKTTAPAAKAPGKSAGGSGKEPMIRVRTGSPAGAGGAAGSGEAHATLSPAAQQALLVVTTYLDQLKSGQPFDAVDQQFDTDVLLHSVFGEDLKEASAGELRYLSDLTRSLLKTAVTVGPTLEAIKALPTSDPEVVQAGEGQVKVRFARMDAKPGEPDGFSFLVLKGSAGWKIVDMPPMGENWRNQYAKSKHEGVTPTDFTEALMATVIARKLDARGAEVDGGSSHDADEKTEKPKETTDASQRQLDGATKRQDRK